MTDTQVPMTDIVVTTALPLSPDQARDAMRTYQEISAALLGPNDIQVIQTRKGNRDFPKRSAFQKLANAYRVSTEVVDEHIEYDDDGILRARYRVRAIHPDGRYTEGTGSCARTEDRFRTNSDKIDHDLTATAETRATNRAISNLVAFGAVSAEEADTTTDSPPADTTVIQPPGWATHITDVGPVAQQLTDLYAALGATDPAAHAIEVGQNIFDHADNGMPAIVATTIAALHAAISPADPAPAAADGQEGPTA